MAATNWVWARGATHNSSTINGVVAFGNSVDQPEVSSPSTDGIKRLVGAYPSVNVSLILRDYAQVLTTLAAAKANFVGKFLDDAGANKKRTILNVCWKSHQPCEVMEPGASGPTPAWRLDGIVDVGTSSLATLIVDAADA